jgi:SMI1-KNR4 cell-wall
VIQRFSEQGPPLTEEDVIEVERTIGVPLPSDYREFLRTYNGGRPEPCDFPIEGLANSPFGEIQTFFGIHDPIESCNLDWNVEMFTGRLPENFLPIACDSGGDLICYSLFGDDAGAVVFWDYHHEPPEPSYENVYAIANSFPAFLESIRDEPL